VSELLLDVRFFVLRLDWISLLDILLVTGIFFFLLNLVRGTQAVVLLRGMILLIIAIAVLTGILDLRAFSWVLRNSLPALLVAVPVIFAPEIRRALERLGRAGRFFTINAAPGQIEAQINLLGRAAGRLSDQRFGALIVIERDTRLDEYMETGVALDATISEELLLQIFYVNTPLHDGAVIVREDRIPAAACVMPLSASGTLSRSPRRQMGLRHRAALGISEVSDAMAVVVSEETGGISVAHNGRMIRRLDQTRLRNILTAFYRPQAPRDVRTWLRQALGRIGELGPQGRGG
jgi:diadenylate cyclase